MPQMAGVAVVSVPYTKTNPNDDEGFIPFRPWTSACGSDEFRCIVAGGSPQPCKSFRVYTDGSESRRYRTRWPSPDAACSARS